MSFFGCKLITEGNFYWSYYYLQIYYIYIGHNQWKIINGYGIYKFLIFLTSMQLLLAMLLWKIRRSSILSQITYSPASLFLLRRFILFLSSLRLIINVSGKLWCCQIVNGKNKFRTMCNSLWFYKGCNKSIHIRIKHKNTDFSYYY